MADIPDIRNFPKERPDLRGSPKGLLDLWMKDNIDWMESCIPAIFLGYQNNDRNTGYGIIRPLIQKKSPDGTVTDRGRYLLPIRQFQHGTFMINAPLVEGDTGWIVAGDRDNTNAIQVNSMIQGRESGIGKKGAQGVPIGNEGPQPPNQFDSHKYLYGFFLPDKWGGVPLPEEFKDSLVIGQVSAPESPDAAAPSYGRFVLDPDGTIHVLSARHYDEKAQKLRGGAVYIDLSLDKDAKPVRPDSDKIEEILGQLGITAIAEVQGEVNVKPWYDPDGKPHGGNLSVEKDATVGGSLAVQNGAKVEKGLSVDGNTDINGRVVIKHDTSRTVTIDGHDLINGDAKFVKKTIVTGKDRNRSHGGKVYLTTEETYVLADRGKETPPIDLSDIAGEGGDDVAVDAISVAWHEKRDDDGNPTGGEELAVKGWHNQKDVNGEGSLPEGETETEGDPEGTGGDVSIESMIIEGNGDNYREYQVLGRKKPGGPLVYIPITKSDSSEDSSGGDSSSESGGDSSGDSGDSSGESGGDSSEDPPEPPATESEPVVTKVRWNTEDGKHQLEYDAGTINLRTGAITPDGQSPHVIVTADPCDCGGGGSGGDIPDFDFVADVRYDPETKQLQKKMGHFVNGEKTVDDWTMMEGGQAVPHSSTVGS